MKDQISPCPKWMVNRLENVGGHASFEEYMDWALNDLTNGFYANGVVNIGHEGDFATSPSIGDEFANLLAIQIVEWFQQLDNQCLTNNILHLVEFGPGEGDLISDLITALNKLSPQLLSRIQFLLVEPNNGMLLKQKRKLQKFSDISLSWVSYEDLKTIEINGVLICHEMLDSLPVERLCWKHNRLYRQGVCLREDKSVSSLDFTYLPIPDDLQQQITEVTNQMGFDFPPVSLPEGWTSEWHSQIGPWFNSISSSINSGILLVIDYMMEAKRYYNTSRSSGTLLAYKNQNPYTSFLDKPGNFDLTSHLCLETLLFYAHKNGWNLIGERRQGESLLALGLAGLISGLRDQSTSNLSEVLNRRENLLSLIDPLGLGEFRWVAFEFSNSPSLELVERKLKTRFLEEPIY